MSQRVTRHLTVGVLVVLLGVSLAANWLLFRYARAYYLQLNQQRLHPLGLNAYSTGEPSDLPDPDLTSVVFLGDSRAESWPSPTMPGFAFANRGLGAQTSAQVLLRLQLHVAPLEPDVVLVQVGINDLKTIPLFPGQQETIIHDCQENIEQIVARCTDLGARVILTTIFPVGKPPLERRLFWSDRVAEAVQTVNAHLWSLEGENVTVFDTYTVLAGPDGLIEPAYGEDLLHLTEAGYAALNGELVRVLEGPEQPDG